MHLLAWRATRNPNDNDYRIRFGDDRAVSSEPSRCFQEYSTEAVSCVSFHHFSKYSAALLHNISTFKQT